jgi:hypothetical protein
VLQGKTRLATVPAVVATILPPSRERFTRAPVSEPLRHKKRSNPMNSIIYIVGLIVIVMAILSFIGLA